jgi:hypothetical protein
MLVKVFGSAVFGINATIVTAEVNVENGAFFFWWACRTAR